MVVAAASEDFGWGLTGGLGARSCRGVSPCDSMRGVPGSDLFFAAGVLQAWPLFKTF